MGVGYRTYQKALIATAKEIYTSYTDLLEMPVMDFVDLRQAISELNDELEAARSRQPTGKGEFIDLSNVESGDG